MLSLLLLLLLLFRTGYLWRERRLLLLAMLLTLAVSLMPPVCLLLPLISFVRLWLTLCPSRSALVVLELLLPPLSPLPRRLVWRLFCPLDLLPLAVLAAIRLAVETPEVGTDAADEGRPGSGERARRASRAARWAADESDNDEDEE
jgi:hypothetical protein